MKKALYALLVLLAVAVVLNFSFRVFGQDGSDMGIIEAIVRSAL